MKNIFKALFIPSGEKTKVIAYNSWIVRWYAVRSTAFSFGGFSFNDKEMSEIFPSEEDANKFAEQLRQAFKLLKHDGDAAKVKVEANQSKLATIAE
jgi:hypothetical protein